MRKTTFWSNESKVKTASKKRASTNSFVAESLKESAVTMTGNGGKAYETSGLGPFIDQFANTGAYLQRDEKDIFSDMAATYAYDPKTAIQFTIYLRIITRNVKDWEGEELGLHKGGGFKKEAILRMYWLGVHHYEEFANNLPLFISAGSTKDLIELMTFDLLIQGETATSEEDAWQRKALDWEEMADFVKAALSGPHAKLMQSYLPTIRARSACNTARAQARVVVGKFLASKLVGKDNYKAYRKLKNGHGKKWQAQISKGLMKEIDFKSIHGRALAKLVGSKFLENQGLYKDYVEWIKSQPVAKFTGYVHELVPSESFTRWRMGSLKLAQEITANKQFKGLIETVKAENKGETNLLCVIDTSGSMMGDIPGAKVSALHVATSLTVYFSELLEGPFKNVFYEFSDTCKAHRFKTEEFCDKMREVGKLNTIGTTEFLSVAQKLVKIKNQGVHEEDFPKGILAMSDGEFNSMGGSVFSYGRGRQTLPDMKTSFEKFREILQEGGFSEAYVNDFKIILWDIRNDYYGTASKSKFQTYGKTKNNFHISGFDGAAITFLLGGEEVIDEETGEKKVVTPQTPEEMFEAAMNQELLKRVHVD